MSIESKENIALLQKRFIFHHDSPGTSAWFPDVTSINLFQKELIARDHFSQSCHASRFLVLLRCLEPSTCCVNLTTLPWELLGQIVSAECCELVRCV